MSGEPKILLMRLFERTSERGTRYLFGRLGQARVVAFLDESAEPKYGATATFNVYVQTADQPRQDVPPPRRAPARRTAKPKAPADDGVPPPNDPLEDLWR